MARARSVRRIEHWPNLYRAHCERYHVKRTYSHQELTSPRAGLT